MANGKYHIQIKQPDGTWRTDLRMCLMGERFAKGCMFALRGLNGGGMDYRLVRGDYGSSDVEVLEEHHTGNIRVNAQEAE